MFTNFDSLQSTIFTFKHTRMRMLPWRLLWSVNKTIHLDIIIVLVIYQNMLLFHLCLLVLPTHVKVVIRKMVLTPCIIYIFTSFTVHWTVVPWPPVTTRWVLSRWYYETRWSIYRQRTYWAEASLDSVTAQWVTFCQMKLDIQGKESIVNLNKSINYS